MVGVQEMTKTRNIACFEDRLKWLKRRIKKEVISDDQIIHNHIPGNGLLGNKKAMFLCMKEYCRLTDLQIFKIVPKTFIIDNGLQDPTWNLIVEYFNERKKLKRRNYWILKPG